MERQNLQDTIFMNNNKEDAEFLDRTLIEY